MAQFPGLLLWTDSWVADTAHLTRLERGTYFDLLVLMWRTPGCRVPNDNAWLAKHMRMSLEEISQELRPIISEFCQTDGNHLFQKRLQKEFVRAFRHSSKQSDRAKSRWQKEKGLYGGNAAHAVHPTQVSRRESFFSRAREDDEPEEVADKKAGKISAELFNLVAAKRSTSEE
jgi:uncharacterized protein YdaU (DUF1376 family)